MLRNIWKNRSFSLASFAALLNYGATWGMAFLLSLYLQYIKGFSPQDAGFLLVIEPIIQSIVSPMVGRLSDRVQPRLVASAGMIFTVLGLLFFTFLDKETSIWIIITGLALVGFGVAVFVTPNTNAMEINRIIINCPESTIRRFYYIYKSNRINKFCKCSTSKSCSSM